MTPADFIGTISHPAPPRELTPALAALWWAKKGDWGKAHQIVQDAVTADAAWVHAYLHRVEGDLGNAAYWYRQAGKPAASGDLDAEWAALTEVLLRAGAKQSK